MKTKRDQILTALLAAAITLGNSRAAEIHTAAEADDVTRIQVLLATNHDVVHSAGKDNLTPLHSAARSGRLRAASLLLEHGADVNAADIHGCTPLHSAVYGKHFLVAEYLLDHGAKVDAARTDGTTPLFYAAGDGDTNLASLLLQRGANPDARSGSSQVALLVAAMHGHQAVVAMLAAAGAKLDAKDQSGHTALHAAAGAGRRETVAWLLDHGADANAEDRFNRRAVDYVMGATNDALVLLLAQHMAAPKDFEPPTTVGPAGDLDRILFEGAETFTSEQLGHALAVKPGFLLVAHPQANLSPFLEELKTMILAGYRSEGFPDAQVEVKFDPTILRARVKVSEGPRFMAGKIRVEGASASLRRELVRWFTTPAERSKPATTKEASLKSQASGSSGPDGIWTVEATAGLTDKKRTGLNTPGKAERPDDPIWIAGDPADFSEQWATQAVAQVEACLAEQGFFFPEAKVELQRVPATGAANLLITLKTEGPPGVIGQINVTGGQLHTADDIIRFLKLRKGTKLTAERLVEVRRSLRDCGRFWKFEVTPEYPGSADKVSSRHVNLHIEVEELQGIPHLNEPLNPTQQALLRLCDWLERFPSRDEEISMSLRDPADLPVAVEFALSPRRGILLSANLEGVAPISAGFLLADDIVQLCAWSSSNKLASTRKGYGTFFLHLLPNEQGGSNRHDLSIGGGYGGSKGPPLPSQRPLLKFDVQLSRAAFLKLAVKEGVGAYVSGSMLVVTNEGFLLRADAKTGRVLEMSRPNDQPPVKLQFGGNVWNRMRGEFTQRSAPLTNIYSPDHEFSSLLALTAGEAANYFLLQEASAANADQRRLASAAVRKLITPEVLGPMDWILPAEDPNSFSIPMSEMERAMAMNSVATLFSGVAFDWSAKMFPKHSWPWTAARESAFVMMNQGRYTDVELERLYHSEETGPIGFLALAHLLKMADSPTAKAFALQGLTRLSAESFLADCNLFLRGESGLARSFAKLVEALRSLPADELAALVAVLPEPEANLLRESATALRDQPEAKPEAVLGPVITQYWQQSLRAKVRAALYQLTTQPTGPGGRTASLPKSDERREPGI